MEQHQNGKQSRGNSESKRDRINVQQYRTGQFEQPEQLGLDYDQGRVQQFDQKIITETIKKAKQKGCSSKRQSIQLQGNKNQVIMQFKISQLQKICSTLTSANEKLLDKIEQLQQQKDIFKGRIRNLQDQKQHQQSQQSKGDQTLSNQNLNQSMQQRQQALLDEAQLQLEEQVVDIEKMIKDYREELGKAEEVNRNCRKNYQKRIQDLLAQLQQNNHKLSQTQTFNKELEEQFLDLQQRNQALEAQIQSIINSNAENAFYEQVQPKRRADSRSSQYQGVMQERRYNTRGNRQWNGYYDEDEYSQMSPFDSSVQIQLQKLIEKLVRQLQHQRSLKKRITEQMKRIQKQLLQSGKQIMSKNKRIYQLQMNVIKGQKSNYLKGTGATGNRQVMDLRSQRYSASNGTQLSSGVKEKYSIKDKEPQRIVQNFSPSHQRKNRPEFLERSSQYSAKKQVNTSSSGKSSNKLLQSFNLRQLLNQAAIVLTISQKLHIGIKIVNFYEQKIYQYQNYKLLKLENIVVTNFNRINLRLIKIRAEESQRDDSKDKYYRNNQYQNEQVTDGPQKVIWNVGYILNSLLLDVPSKQQDFGISSIERGILQEIQMIMDNKHLNQQALSKLRSLLEEDSAERANK